MKIEHDKPRILHFEDEKVTQRLIQKVLGDQLGAEVITVHNYLTADFRLNSSLIDTYDAIICDYMTPVADAGSKLKMLLKFKRPIIFYTCLDHQDFSERCLKVIPKMPKNFHFVRKASNDQLKRIINIIKESL